MHNLRYPILCVAAIAAAQSFAQPAGHVRRVVVEEFTGTDCGYCPRGWIGMERLRQDGGDAFIGIAVHQYSSKDPMYVADYPDLGLYSAPSCLVNGTEAMDPYYGTSSPEQCYGIWHDFEEWLDTPPVVDVTVQAHYNADETEVTATAQLERLNPNDGADYTIHYVLTADSLAGNVSSWYQHNYYYSETAAAWNAEGDALADFCAGGRYGQAYVLLTYNDVAIAYSTDGHLLMPTRSLLKKALRHDQVYVTALVRDHRGRIQNAARARVLTAAEASAISRIPADVPTSPSAAFTLDGRPCPTGSRGLTVVGSRIVLQR